MKKILALLLALTLTAALCAGCGSTSEETTTTDDTAATQEEDVTIRLGGLKGPTSMGMVKLLADNDAGTTTNSYEFTMAGSADELTPKLLQGELDILAVPVNLGSVLYNNSEGSVQLLAVNTLGVIYLVEKGGQTVTDWASLKGQTIYATGKGSTPEYALNYLLEKNGLDPAADVTIEWKSEPAEIVAQMAAQDHVIALMPQPFVTVAQSKFSDLAVALDLTEEWDKLDNGSQLITAGLVVRKEFAVSLIVSAALAAANGLRIFLQYHDAAIALVISLSLVATVILSKLVGCVLPIAARQLRMDSAIMASPLITTIVDAGAVLIYFQAATAFLPLSV